ncbi:hypothetical protein ETTORE_0375 [Pseudomonas phage Ettore]|nr:hypothetical protein ETTORE_0375 [Pseudomonas phage Ettore]
MRLPRTSTLNSASSFSKRLFTIDISIYLLQANVMCVLSSYMLAEQPSGLQPNSSNIRCRREWIMSAVCMGLGVLYATWCRLYKFNSKHLHKHRDSRALEILLYILIRNRICMAVSTTVHVMNCLL